jgi:plastocyanin
MNFDLIELTQRYWVFVVVLIMISFFIYQIQNTEYFHGVEYFQGEQMGLLNPIRTPVIINIKDFDLSPNYVVITPDTEVKWINVDSGDTQSRSNRVHSLVESQHGLFHSPDLQMNDSFRYKFTLPGTYYYHSRQYPSAKGVITVKMEGN